MRFNTTPISTKEKPATSNSPKTEVPVDASEADELALEDALDELLTLGEELGAVTAVTKVENRNP